MNFYLLSNPRSSLQFLSLKFLFSKELITFIIYLISLLVSIIPEPITDEILLFRILHPVS